MWASVHGLVSMWPGLEVGRTKYSSSSDAPWPPSPPAPPPSPPAPPPVPPHSTPSSPLNLISECHYPELEI